MGTRRGWAALAMLYRLARIARDGFKACAPWLDLATRVALGLGFLRIAVRGAVMGTPMTMRIGDGVLDAVLASPFGFTVQALCPVLLIGGVATRLVVLPLLVQTLLLTSPESASDPDRARAALLLLLAVFGPGALSVDRLLGRGLDLSAVPGARLYAALAEALTRRLGPLLLFGLRIWIAGGLAESAAARWSEAMPARLLALGPPIGMTAGPGGAAAACLALALVVGLCTRVAGAVLVLMLPLPFAGDNGGARLSWLLLCLVPLVRGAGPLSLDAIAAAVVPRAPSPATASEPLHHVVILGGGFAGIAAAKGLRTANCRVTVVDRANHHLFQPLLYQVATAALSPADIATPIRTLLRGQANASVRLDEAVGISAGTREILLSGGQRVGYDTLVLATGARHGYFGRDAWARHAPGLKSIDDATAIRGRLLAAFERAENAEDEDERRAWLTFVVVGGGPTGVELAGAIAELARHGLGGEFRRIDPRSATVLLIQAGPRLLPAFPPSLSGEAAEALRRLGVDLRCDARVDHVGPDGVTVSGVAIAARTVLWAAGVEASPVGAWLDAARDRAGRVLVQPDLTVPDHPEIFAVGDTAAALAWRGGLAPGLAPAARQGGAYAARVIRARLDGRAAPPAFRYRHLGSLATIGRQAAVADFSIVRFRGGLAWWLWSLAHVAFIYGGRNRSAVLLDWAWAYLTLRRGSRLITRSSDAGAP